MRRSKRWPAMLTAAVAVLILSVPATAEAYQRHHRGHRGHRGLHLSFGIGRHYGGFYSSRSYYRPYGYRSIYGDPFHFYSSPYRIHVGPHSGFHSGPHFHWGHGYHWGPHGGPHYNLHGGFGHFGGL